MKKSILFAVAAFSMNALVAQTTTPATTPPAGSTQERRTQTTTTQQSATNQQNAPIPGDITKRFDTEYPNMKSNWSRSGTNYRAEYSDGTTRMGRAIIYDQKGNPVGKEQEIGAGKFPKTINEYYSTNYPNETYKVWNSEDVSGKKGYYVSRKTDVIWFDENGNYKSKSERSTDMMDK